MGQSLVKNYIHLIFSTKQRVPLIHQPVEEELYSYMYGTKVYPALLGLEFVHDQFQRASPCVDVFRSFRAKNLFNQHCNSRMMTDKMFYEISAINKILPTEKESL